MGIRHVSRATENFLFLEMLAFVNICKNKWYFCTSTIPYKSGFVFHTFILNFIKISKHRIFSPNNLYIMKLTVAAKKKEKVFPFCSKDF